MRLAGQEWLLPACGSMPRERRSKRTGGCWQLLRRGVRGWQGRWERVKREVGVEVPARSQGFGGDCSEDMLLSRGAQEQMLLLC